MNEIICCMVIRSVAMFGKFGHYFPLASVTNSDNKKLKDIIIIIAIFGKHHMTG